MDVKKGLIVLGSLLHDVGKFVQRASGKCSKNQEGELCPTGQGGRSSHLHVLYSDAFIEDNSLLPLPYELEGHRSKLARIAAAHHKPGMDSLEELCITQADRLSAGGDRIGQESESVNFRDARMRSTFDYIQLTGKADKHIQSSYYKLMTIDQDPVPTSLKEAQQSSYDDLYQEFISALKDIPVDMGIKHYTASLLSILEKYTWCIPSSTYKTEPDISLYDHSLTTAAIAQALHAYHDEKKGLPGSRNDSDKKFILFGGDLSGIQNYIFNLNRSHGPGVAKILRARSFYLQVLTKSVIISLLDRINLFPTAQIMDAGGRFVLLLPATSNVLTALPGFEKEVQSWFWEKFKGTLALNLSYDVTLTEQDMLLESFQKRLNTFNDRLESRKFRSFDLILQGSPVFDLDYSEYQENGDCNVCKCNPADKDKTDDFSDKYGQEIPICKDCFYQVDYIGRKLPLEKNRYVVLFRKESRGQELFDGYSFKMVHDCSTSDKSASWILNIRNRNIFAHQGIAGYLPTISEQDIERWKLQNRVKDNGEFLEYKDEYVEPDMPKTLNMLADESVIHDAAGPRGKAFLAAFKADVDNLGLIFSTGLGDKMSMSRFAGLSRMFNHFFSDHLVDIIQEKFPDLYIVFAGGDDLFILGPWTMITEFARTISESFASYTGYNQDISISAGIAVVKPRMPINTIAHEAESGLELAKKNKVGKRAKNSVTMFDKSVSWDEFEKLALEGEWLEKMALNNTITMGLLTRLLKYSNEHLAFMGGDIRKGIYISHMRYDFARNLSQHVNEEAKAKLKGISNDNFLMSNMRLPVSMAAYRLRKD